MALVDSDDVDGKFQSMLLQVRQHFGFFCCLCLGLLLDISFMMPQITM